MKKIIVKRKKTSKKATQIADYYYISEKDYCNEKKKSFRERLRCYCGEEF